MNNSTAKAKPKMTVKNGVVYGDALSAQEKKRIVMQKKKDRKAKKVRKSAQQTIPYVEMCRDGICKVNSRLYTKSIAFEDINYQLAQNEDKTAIFENWCDFLNYFDSSIFVQLSFINQKASLNEFRKRINIPAQEDAFNDIRSEYSGMLQSQLTKGNNGLVKKKYITFGIEADSLRTAKPKLERIETDILNNFKTLGVRTEPLSGYERLKVLHDVFNMDTNEPFRFSFDMVARTGLSTKDFIAPTSFDFREGKCFKMGRTIGAGTGVIPNDAVGIRSFFIIGAERCRGGVIQLAGGDNAGGFAHVRRLIHQGIQPVALGAYGDPMIKRLGSRRHGGARSGGVRDQLVRAPCFGNTRNRAVLNK